MSRNCPCCALVHSHTNTGNGGILVGRRQLSEATYFQMFQRLVGGIVWNFPQAQSDPSVAWQVVDALKAAAFSEWAGFKKNNSQMFRSASRYPQKKGSRDSRYASISHRLLLGSETSLTPIQYEVPDTSTLHPGCQRSPPKSYYGRLEHIISVEFSNGYEHLGLWGTVVFAVFRQCILTGKDPRLDRLNIHLYSREDENLQLTEISHVRSLVGRIKDGSDSWAIIDPSGRFSWEAYLTHEARQEDVAGNL